MHYIICIVLMIVIILLAILIAAAHRSDKGGSSEPLKKRQPQAKRTNSEDFTIKQLESITGESFPTAHPKWLKYRGRTLELDGYNPRLKLAIEFSGPLHTKWAPSEESYDKYITRVIKDAIKIKLCEQKGVNLIVIDMTLPRDQQRWYLLSRLHDFNMGERPVIYHDKQTAPVYRNPQLERELPARLREEIAANLS